MMPGIDVYTCTKYIFKKDTRKKTRDLLDKLKSELALNERRVILKSKCIYRTILMYEIGDEEPPQQERWHLS
jgi:hypothetical protein